MGPRRSARVGNKAAFAAVKQAAFDAALLQQQQQRIKNIDDDLHKPSEKKAAISVEDAHFDDAQSQPAAQEVDRDDDDSDDVMSLASDASYSVSDSDAESEEEEEEECSGCIFMTKNGSGCQNKVSKGDLGRGSKALERLVALAEACKMHRVKVDPKRIAKQCGESCARHLAMLFLNALKSGRLTDKASCERLILEIVKAATPDPENPSALNQLPTFTIRHAAAPARKVGKKKTVAELRAELAKAEAREAAAKSKKKSSKRASR